jgi:MoxR-like ATPase
MCLQPILEGKGVFLKKINEWVKPAAGFTVFATANTKGKGDDTGAFAHTGILNEAFLDRFPVTLEQAYAANGVEKRIILRKMKTLGVEDKDFAGNLVKWADAIRKTFMEGGISEIITTRRLLSITQAFSIFNDKAKAIEMAISRLDEETKHDFLKLYEKIDAEVEISSDSASAPVEIDPNNPNTCPY